SRTAMDGAKCPLEWVPQGLTELLQNFKQLQIIRNTPGAYREHYNQFTAAQLQNPSQQNGTA
ncbi:MAG: hypothetical protein ACP5FP_07495, partial [Desulfuromonadaceae bacterium]